MSTFHSFNVTAAMRQDIAVSVPSPHTTTCSLSQKSICSLAAASRLARVIPKTTSLQRTSGCTLHKLNRGLHLHRDRQSGFNPWGIDSINIAVTSTAGLTMLWFRFYVSLFAKFKFCLCVGYESTNTKPAFYHLPPKENLLFDIPLLYHTAGPHVWEFVFSRFL